MFIIKFDLFRPLQLLRMHHRHRRCKCRRRKTIRWRTSDKRRRTRNCPDRRPTWTRFLKPSEARRTPVHFLSRSSKRASSTASRPCSRRACNRSNPCLNQVFRAELTFLHFWLASHLSNNNSYCNNNNSNNFTRLESFNFRLSRFLKTESRKYRLEPIILRSRFSVRQRWRWFNNSSNTNNNSNS